VLLGYHWENPNPDLLYIAAVLVLGAIGAALQALTSYGTYRGNQTFESSWGWWYLIRLPLGSAVALALYLVLRAGLLSTGTSTGSISPYGIGAVALLAGLFSKQTIDKLKEAFESIFPTRADAARANKVQGDLAVTGATPNPIPVGTPSLSIQLVGTGLGSGMTATVGGTGRSLTVHGPTTADLALQASDVAAPGQLDLVVTSPGPAGASSQPFTLHVGSPPSAFSAHTPPSPVPAGTPYGQYSFVADGSPAPSYTASGNLPPGLTFDTGGILQGTPTDAGSYTFNVRASNPLGAASSGNVTIEVTT
jgi:hypothetical protein